MNVDRGRQLADVVVEVNEHQDLVQHRRSLGANEVAAQDRVVGRGDQQLGALVVDTGRPCPRAGGPVPEYGDVWCARVLELLLGGTNTRNLGSGKDRVWDLQVIDRALRSVDQAFLQIASLIGGGVLQHVSAIDVAQGVNAFDCRL